ncbi:hypothetical protein ACHAXM_002064 [Skeletonema potamos]
MKSTAALTILLLSLAKEAMAFSANTALPSSSSLRVTITASSSPLFAAAAANNNNDDDHDLLSRRDLLTQTALTFTAATTTLFASPLTALAADEEITSRPTTSNVVVVAGATGQTGRRILERLLIANSQSSNNNNTRVIAAVRNIDKASKSLSESSTVIRGAMIQTVPSLATAITTTGGSSADSLVIAVGFVPGLNPLKMNAAAHEVDNVGTCKLIDAAKAAGIKKIVLVSSILTNGRNWGQEKSPGFTITNAFGNVLDEKLVAEQYLRASGIDYTIVRPGGLKSKPPTGALRISGEDTLNSGEISRDLVADVCVASLTDGKARNKVLEIIEDEESGPKVFNGLNM